MPTWVWAILLALLVAIPTAAYLYHKKRLAWPPTVPPKGVPREEVEKPPAISVEEQITQLEKEVATLKKKLKDAKLAGRDVLTQENKLVYADMHLDVARVAFFAGDRAEAVENITKAREIILKLKKELL
jgi:hypothetical protein